MAVICDYDSSGFITRGEFNRFKKSVQDRIDRLSNDAIRQLDGIVAMYFSSMLPKINKSDINELLKEIDNIKLNTSNKQIDMILVEGITDKEYLELAIRFYSPKLYCLINENKLEIFVNKFNGGVKNLTYNLQQRIINKVPNKSLALFDCDEAAKNEISNIFYDSEIRKLSDDKTIKILKIRPSCLLKKISKELKNMPDFSIEHLLSLSFWKELKEKEYIEKSNKDFVFKFIPKNLKYDEINLKDYSINDSAIIDSFFGYYPKENKKNNILDLLKSKSNDEQKCIMAGFTDTILEIEKFFVEN